MAAADLDEDELRELTLSISRLPKAELEALMTTITKLQPSYTKKGIDLSALSTETLLNVQQFVRTTHIDYGPIHFLVTDSPKSSNIKYYLKTYKDNDVTDVVRTSDAEYSEEELTREGIAFHEMRFEDGDVASGPLIDDWLALVDECYLNPKSGKHRKIAIHCAAGLGRAPFLVALALVQAGMDNYQAVEYIRSVRRGAINKRQLEYILKFKPRKMSTIKKLFKFF